VKTALRVTRDRLSAEVVSRLLAPADYPATYAAEADEWISRLFAEATEGKTAGFALVGVGGYGRSELCPGSDLDVMLVHQRRRNVKQVADKLWYSVWDGGVKLDHSVRTPKEAISVAREDQRALLGLLDGRVIAGDADLAAGVLDEVANWWRVHNRELLPQLSAAGSERHERFGEVPFLLEPDLKESAGGLRDLEALELAARAAPALAPVLLPPELKGHRRLLLSARVTLHAVTGGSSDRLALQEQDEVAPLLGFADADALMAGISAAGREVMWASADGWRRLDSYLAGPSGRAGGRDIALVNGVVLRDGTVALATDPDATELGDGTLAVRLAAAAAEYGAPIATTTLERLVEAGITPGQPWGEDLRQGFVSLLEFGPAATPVLEMLDQRHLLERLLPEWLAVRHLPQRNAYHRFTVDRHLLEAVAQAALLIRSVRRPDLLLVSALLHDIAKGQPGDHSVVGRDIAIKVAQRMGFAAADTELIGRVVEFHLLLADTATRRDLDDPATIESVAQCLKDREAIEVLAALTEADSIATGPTAWSPWKAGLVSELAARADAYLREVQEPDAERAVFGRTSAPTAQQLGMASSRSLGVLVEDGKVTVVAPDHPGLLSLVAGTLALHRLSIRSAVAMDGGGGMAIEVFGVSRPTGDRVDARRLRLDLEQALDGRLLLEARLATLESAYARRRRAAAASPSQVKVIVDDTASAQATVIEVRAPDSHGLLHRLTRILAEAGLDVISARVSTIGHEVVDAFYVRDGVSGQPPDAEALRPLEPLLVAGALARP